MEIICDKDCYRVLISDHEHVRAVNIEKKRFDATTRQDVLVQSST